jgi:glycosyltransferase involved in cell wall biosynthesis
MLLAHGAQEPVVVSRGDRRKTIVFCCNSLWGLVNFRDRVIAALASDGHRVVLVAHPDVPVDNVARLGAEFVEWKLAPRGINPVREASAVVRLWRIYRRLQPDLAFHFTIKPVIYGAVVTRLARVRCISVVTGLGYLFLAENWRLRMAKALYRFTLRRSHEVWFLNADDREFFSSHGLTADVAVRTLPGEGVDVERFARVPLPDATTRFVFLMIARLVKDKGVLEFGQAAARVKAADPRAVFRLLGPSYRANDMSVAPALIDEWSSTGRVEYLGERDDVRPVIAEAHCVVLPSYREGMPRVLMEAAAMGRPAVATDVPGCRDVIIDGETGILCQARSADALAEACLHLLAQSRGDTDRMADRAYQSALARFDDRKVISIYREVVARLGDPGDPS